MTANPSSELDDLYPFDLTAGSAAFRLGDAEDDEWDDEDDDDWDDEDDDFDDEEDDDDE